MANAANFNDLYKMFGKFKAPAMDFGNVISLQRGNVEACIAANQAFIECAQETSRRSAEAARECVENCLSTARDIMTSTSPENNTAKQADLCRSVYENAVSNSREISDLWSKSCLEAWNMLSKRASASVGEASRTAKRAASGN